MPTPPTDPSESSVRSPSHTAQTRSSVGTNLAGIGYPTFVNPFIDLMKGAEPFFSGSAEAWRDGRPLAKDGRGYVRKLDPGQVARSFVLGEGAPQPAGKVTVLYKGEGTLEYRERVTNLKRSPGRDEFTLDGTGGFYLTLTSVNPHNHLRDVHIYMDSVGGPDSGTFSKPFLDSVREFSVLRAMNWTGTNREAGLVDGEQEPFPYRRWKDYPQRDAMVWSPAPFDVITELGNTLNRDIWLNVPHSADDDFVKRMAQQVHDTLEPERTVYVEYSNETWNDMFDQAFYVGRRGCEMFASDPVAECTVEGTSGLCQLSDHGVNAGCYTYGLKYHAVRTAEVMAIWEAVFSDRRDKLIRVLGGRIGGMQQNGVAQLNLKWKGEEPVHRRVDLYAVAPYFYGDLTTSVDAFFATAPKGTNGIPKAMPAALAGFPDPDLGLYAWIKSDVQLLSAFPSVSIAAYEGGQHLMSYEDPERKRVVEINRDPRMKALYLAYLDMWAELSDGALFVHFTSPEAWTEFGAWGSKEYPAQPRKQAPKHDALLLYIERSAKRTTHAE